MKKIIGLHLFFILLSFCSVVTAKTKIQFQIVDSISNAQPDSISFIVYDDNNVEILRHFQDKPKVVHLPYGSEVVRSTYEIPLKAKGKHTLTVSAPGYEERSIEIQPAKGERLIDLGRVYIKRKGETPKKDKEVHGRGLFV